MRMFGVFERLRGRRRERLIERAVEAAGLDEQGEIMARKKSPEQLARRIVLLTRERRELRKRLGDV